MENKHGNKTRTADDFLAELVEGMGGGGYAEWKSVQLPPPSRVRIAWLHARRWLGDLLVRAGEAIR